MLQLTLMQKRRELVLRTEADALIDQIAGTVLTHLGGTVDRWSRDKQSGATSTRSSIRSGVR
jgi:hypothetical protein